MEIEPIFEGTALHNDLVNGVIWAGGKIYRTIDPKECVLKRGAAYSDWPSFCPFAESSKIYGMKIYPTADVNYFTFEVA